MLNKDRWSCNLIKKRYAKGKIHTNPHYQRPPVWTNIQKQLLIDSILRGYDIPKIYLHLREDGTWDVIDGQQRIRTIYSFFKDEFALAKDAAPVDGVEVAHKKYSELPEDISEIIDNYLMDCVILDTQNEEEIREMFLRLQNGSRLKAQEKRNAMPGKMRDFIKNIAKHPFFEKLPFANSRYTYDLIAAQMTLLALKRDQGICNIKNRDLNEMYEDQKEFDANSEVAKNIKRVLNYLNRMFSEDAHELQSNGVTVSLFLLIMDLLPTYVLKNREADLYAWFRDFEAAREKNKKEDPKNRDPGLTAYQGWIKSSTDSKDSLQQRHEFLKNHLLAHLTEKLVEKDPKRFFDDGDRQIIFTRDKGICQNCHKKCTFTNGNWEADHIVPWSEGGRTNAENGQVLCPTCNAKKKDKLKKEEE